MLAHRRRSRSRARARRSWPSTCGPSHTSGLKPVASITIVERAVLGGGLGDRLLLGGDVGGAELLDQVAVRYGARRQRDAGDLDAAQAQRPAWRAGRRCPSRARRRACGCQTFSRRWISNAWSIAFSATVSGSSSTPVSLKAVRQRHDVLVVLDVVLGQVAVALVDAALEVDVVGGHVLEADRVVDARAGPADAGDHDRPGLDVARHVRPHLDHAAERLVAGDQVVVARRARRRTRRR